MKSTIENILRNKGLRVTSTRKSVLDAIVKFDSALTHTELEKKLINQLDRVTLYRVLDAFHNAGILHRFSDIEGATRYAMCEFDDCDKNHQNDSHMHFRCLKCGKVSCLHEIKPPDIHLPKGYEMTNITLNAEGFCKNCSFKS